MRHQMDDHTTQIAETAEQAPAMTVQQMGSVLLQMEQLMRGMANAVAATNKRMEQLEKQVQQLTPITRAQEKALADKIKLKARQLCQDYGLPAKCSAKISTAIRRSIRIEGGVRALRDLPRIEYAVYVDRIDLWDDYTTMRGIRTQAKKEAANE